MDAIFKLFEQLPQQGPGSDRSTRRALSALPKMPSSPRVFDLGCGTGRQTLVLARETGGTVTAVDPHEPFLAKLQERALDAGLSGRIRTRAASILELDDEPDRCRLVWSEGALYTVGLERALSIAHRLLERNGLLAFTELTWLTPDPPPPAREFWTAAYPDMGTVDVNSARCRTAGFRVLDTFPLPPEDWTQEYYAPSQQAIAELRRERGSLDELEGPVAELEREFALFEKYGSCYGYVFYIVQRDDG